jgi:conjugal transfer mating pair stabilization protein TraG
LDQYGLRGDTQRLASQWQAAGWIADSDQAYAGAGMSLLTGFSVPYYRNLDNQQARSAEMAGYQLLGDAFHAPNADPAFPPQKNEMLSSQVPILGSVQSTVKEANLSDPRQAVNGIMQQVQSKMTTTHDRLESGKEAIEQHHQQNIQGAGQHSIEGFAELAHIKTEHFSAALTSAANDTPSAAELSYNMLGGSLYNTAKNIEAVGSAGTEYVKNFTGGYQEAMAKGLDKWDAVKYAASQSYPGFIQATQAWADQRVDEVADRLTPNQQAYYRAAMFEAFAGIAVGSNYTGSMGTARQQLLDEEGDLEGEAIAKLLRNAAGQNRPDLINQIGNFNRSRGRVNY